LSWRASFILPLSMFPPMFPQINFWIFTRGKYWCVLSPNYAVQPIKPPVRRRVATACVTI